MESELSRVTGAPRLPSLFFFLVCVCVSALQLKRAWIGGGRDAAPAWLTGIHGWLDVIRSWVDVGRGTCRAQCDGGDKRALHFTARVDTVESYTVK